MTEQKLNDKITALLEEVWSAGRDYSQLFDFPEYLNRNPQWKTSLFAFLKEADEEIAEIIKQSAYALSDKHKKEVDEARIGYVQLAEDQTLPQIPDKHKNYPGYTSPVNDAWQDCYKWFRRKIKDWRKVEL